MDGLGRIYAAIILLVIVFTVLSTFSGRGYSYHSGYYGHRYGHRHHHHHRPHRSHGGGFGSSIGRSSCVSSCACACACAGGGRAGCSKKDFYGKNLRTSQLNKILKQK